MLTSDELSLLCERVGLSSQAQAILTHIGVITFFRTVFPVKQDAIHAEEGEKAFPPGKWGRNPSR